MVESGKVADLDAFAGACKRSRTQFGTPWPSVTPWPTWTTSRPRPDGPFVESASRPHIGARGGLSSLPGLWGFAMARLPTCPTREYRTASGASVALPWVTLWCALCASPKGVFGTVLPCHFPPRGSSPSRGPHEYFHVLGYSLTKDSQHCESHSPKIHNVVNLTEGGKRHAAHQHHRADPDDRHLRGHPPRSPRRTGRQIAGHLVIDSRGVARVVRTCCS